MKTDMFVDDVVTEPGAPKRRCTDMFCFIFFALSMGCLGYTFKYAYMNGDIQRLHHPMSATGNFCGLDVPEKYLYLCPGAGLPLSLGRSMCVDKCPSAGEPISCPGSMATWGYESKRVGGKYCMPEDPMVKGYALQAFNVKPIYRVLLILSEVTIAWRPILSSAAMAVALGAVYIIMLRMGARCILHLCGSTVSILLLGVGIYLIGYYDQNEAIADGSFNPKSFKVQVPTEFSLTALLAVPINMIAGAACILCGALLLAVFLCCGRALDQSIKTVEASCECILSMPGILFEPLVHLALKGLLVYALVYGFFLLLSCGQVESVFSASEGDSYRSFIYSNFQIKAMLFYLVMCCWIMEIFNALTQFVISYVVQAWYFTPVDASWPPSVRMVSLFRGYSIGIFYHLGTLAVGAFFCIILRPAQVILEFFAHHASRGNTMAELLACCCCLCTCCLNNCIGFLSKNAFMDTAINGSGFCTASLRVSRIFAIEFATVGVLWGACLKFQIIGIAFITGVGGAISWLLLKMNEEFNTPKSESYIQDPVIMALVSCSVCCLVAVPFMIMFDHVADTMFYCFAIEKRRQRQGGANLREYHGWRSPNPKFKKLVNETD